MGNLSICDICNCPIKPEETIYKMAIQTVSPKSMYSIEDYNKQIDNLDIKMICEKCKKIYDYLFNIRKEELAKLQKEIEKSFKEKPNALVFSDNIPKHSDYCKCIYPHAVKDKSGIWCLVCSKVIADACICSNPELDIYTGRCVNCGKRIYITNEGY